MPFIDPNLKMPNHPDSIQKEKNTILAKEKMNRKLERENTAPTKIGKSKSLSSKFNTMVKTLFLKPKSKNHDFNPPLPKFKPKIK